MRRSYILWEWNTFINCKLKIYEITEINILGKILLTKNNSNKNTNKGPILCLGVRDVELTLNSREKFVKFTIIFVSVKQWAIKDSYDEHKILKSREKSQRFMRKEL